MNFKDRGNKKWNSLMLVEHQKKLKELKEKENQQEKPELDQQKLEEINQILIKAYKKNIKVKISYFQNKKIKTTKVKIKKIDNYSRELLLQKENLETFKIEFKNLLDIKL